MLAPHEPMQQGELMADCVGRGTHTVGMAFQKGSCMLQVFGKSESINVRKVLWLCTELDIPYENEQGGGQVVALNPNALFPVIRDGALVLRESNTICRYLASRERRIDLLPADPVGRARVEQWMDWQATELNDSWRYAFMGLVRRSPVHNDTRAIADSVSNWNAQMEILEGQLAATHAYLVGGAFTLADVVVGLSVHRWFMTPVERPPLPAITAYYELLSERPAFMRWGRNGIP
jgi:glutathione S-transferase